MERTVKDMIDAGALRQLCLYHSRRRTTDADWGETTHHAIREFPDVPVATIKALIERCVQSCNAAQGIKLGLGLPDGYAESCTECK